MNICLIACVYQIDQGNPATVTPTTKMAKDHIETVTGWLKANGMNTAALTSQDTRALKASTAAAHLYSTCDERCERRAAIAFGQTVQCMQSHTRHLAFHAIAKVSDWGFRAKLWEAAGLEPLQTPGRCKNE